MKLKPHTKSYEQAEANFIHDAILHGKGIVIIRSDTPELVTNISPAEASEVMALIRRANAQVDQAEAQMRRDNV